MKSKVILFCALLFCSKIVDSVPHSENHVRQRVNPLSNWQVNKNIPNVQYLDTDFTQPRNVNKLTNSGIQQENNEDYYSNQRGYNYDTYGYNKGPASSPSAKELLVNYDFPADGHRLDSYPPRVESYPSHTSQVGFDHQQYRNQKWQSKNPFTNSVPSSVFIPNDERPLVTSVQEPYRGLAQYVEPKYVPSLNQPFYQPGRSYLTREPLQYPSVDHSDVNKYAVNPATRFGSRGLVSYENYSESQASETKTRPTGVHRHVRNLETPAETNYENPAVESPDTLVDQSESIRYPVPYENYRESQVSETKTRPTGVRRDVQDFEIPSEINYEIPAAESPDTLVDRSENIRYPVPYENYREGQVPETKTRPNGVRRHVQDFEIPSEINYEIRAVKYPDTLVDRSENIRYVEKSRSGSHLSNSAPIISHDYGTPVISETDNYSSDSRPSNLAPVVNVKKEATVEISKILADKPVARKYAHRSDYEWSNIARDNANNDAPTDIIETVEVKEAKYGTNYAEEKPVPTNRYPEDSLTPTNTILENSGSHTYEESNVPQHESSSVNNSKQNAIHHLTSEIKGLSLKSLVANPEIQHILSRTDKRYVVVHSNGTIEYLDTLPLDSQQDSKLHLVHTKGDGVLTPQWSKNSPNNIAKTPTPVDEYHSPTNNQPADEYDSNRVIPFENLSAGHSNLEPLLPHAKELADNENSKPLPPSVNQSAGGGNSKPLISNQDQPVDDSNSNQPEDDDNSKLLAPNEAQPAYDANPKTTSENLSGDDDNSNPLLHDVNHPTDDDILKHWTSSENQPRDYDSPKPLLTEVNQSKDKINLTSYARNPVHAKIHKHAYETHPANHNTFKPLLPNEAQPGDDSIHFEPFPAISQPAHYTKPKHSHVNQPKNYDNSKPSDSPVVNQPANDNNSEPFNENLSGDDIVPNLLNLHYIQHKKSKHSHVNKPADDNNSNQPSTPEPLDYPENQPEDDNPAKSLPSHKSGDNKKSKPSDTNEYQTIADNDSEPLPSHKKHPADRHNSKHFYGNQHEDDDNSNLASEKQSVEDKTSKPLTANENDISPSKQPGDDNTPKTSSDENQPVDDKNLKSLKLLSGIQPGDDESPSSYENEPADNKTPKKLPHSADESKSTPSPHKKKQAHRSKSQSKLSHVNQSANDSTSKPLLSNENYVSPDKQPENDDSPKPSLSPENWSEDDNDSKPLPPNKRRRAHRNKSKRSNVNKPANDNNLTPASPEKNQQEEDNGSKRLPSNADQSGDKTDSTPSLSHKKQPAHQKKPKHSIVNLESDDNSANPSSQDENQQGDDKADENQSEDETITTPLSPHKKLRAHHKKPKHSDVNKSVDDNNSKTSLDEIQTEDDKKSKTLPTSESQSTNDNNSKPSPPEENQPEDDIKSKPTPSVSSKNDDESRSTTLSPTVPSYTTTPKPQAIKIYKRKHSHRKTTTNSPVAKTTPSPDDSSEDQIITLSPIEHVTDNARDVPTLTTTTTKPVETKKYTYKDANNKPDEAQDDTKSSSEDLDSISDKVQTSITTATPSSSTSPTDSASDDKTKGKSEENENKAVLSKENNGKDTAVYNSSELLDTNTDVPEETDDYSPVTPSPSVQNDVDTGDASGDNSSELEQSETDVTITVSGSTTYDSEDEIITINIEISESTDDADSPSNDKTLVVSIGTNPDKDDVSKTTKTEDCKEDHNHDDGRGKNIEIDLSNLKGQPTMWIKTTNQDFIDKLTAKNDTLFDVIYFFSIENQPTIDREKETTIFCNGTVVIETTEITYAYKDDPTPTIVKTTEIMEIEDYELYK